MRPTNRGEKPGIGWQEVDDKVLFKVAEAVRRYFGPGHADVSATDAVISAARMALEKKIELETLADLERWLVRVAWRKYKDSLKKSHRDRRKPFPQGRDGEMLVPDHEKSDEETVVDAIAGPFFERLIEKLDDEERLILQGKRQGKSHEQMAAELGWTVTEVDNKSKRIIRKGRKLLPEFPDRPD
ncbi:MAG TPA: sigma-70 family RNA polymerase sigma factor [Gemmataceae bacterium]|nr:sigma-70 family RNA polymerase sigma factor [Gemmataceae bacterium]